MNSPFHPLDDPAGFKNGLGERRIVFGPAPSRDGLGREQKRGWASDSFCVISSRK